MSGVAGNGPGLGENASHPEVKTMSDDARPGEAELVPEDPGRRKAFLALTVGAGGLVAGALASAAGKLALAPLLLGGGDGSAPVDLGPAADFAPVKEGAVGAREVVLERTVADGYMRRKLKQRIAVVRDGGAASGLAALSTTCSHLGCGVTWSDERKAFLCPCHGGVYDATGKVTDGPPPRPLTRLPLVLEGGRLRLDPSRLV